MRARASYAGPRKSVRASGDVSLRGCDCAFRAWRSVVATVELILKKGPLTRHRNNRSQFFAVGLAITTRRQTTDAMAAPHRRPERANRVEIRGRLRRISIANANSAPMPKILAGMATPIPATHVAMSGAEEPFVDARKGAGNEPVARLGEAQARLTLAEWLGTRRIATLMRRILLGGARASDLTQAWGQNLMSTGTTRTAHDAFEGDLRRHSAALAARAAEILVGGVDSPVRTFRAVGAAPFFVDRALGSRLWDVDGREYIDYVCSWGALILGHAHPEVVAAVAGQAGRGTSYGMTSPVEIELGERIAHALPSIERIRFVSSGTEATMSAIRLARGFTKRDLILKFQGGYHGHSDGFLVEAGSGLATFGTSSSEGVPEAVAHLTLSAPYNDIGAAREIFRAYPKRVAAVIVEPVAANMGVVPPVDRFLAGLRELTQRDGALLIFDEVITGFRLALGGGQQLYNVTPDLTTIGKIIGGGLPVAAYGGRFEIMKMVAPEGPVYQAGTLSGNPLAMRAGLATLPRLEAPGFYDALHEKAQRLADGFRSALAVARIPGHINVAGSLLTIFFSEKPVRDYGGATNSDCARFAAFFREMLDRGILLPPSQFEALFLSAAHTDAEIDATLSAARASLAAIS